MLGFVDVTVVTSLREAVNAVTGEVVPFADDFTLPIPFRIEAGALTGGASSACKGVTPDCVEVSVKKTGGTFFTNTKWAGIQLESGWVSDEALALGGGSIVLTIERVRAKDGHCHAGSDGEPGEAAALGSLYVELNGCYHYATDPSLVDPRIPLDKRGFQTDNNKVGQCTHELPTDAGMADADYMLFKSDPGQPIVPLKDVPAPVGLSCTDFAFYQALPDNPVLHYASIKLHNLRRALSRFVVNEAYAWDGGLGGTLPKSTTSALSNISRGVGLRAARTSTNNQTGPAGTSIEFRVRVTTEHLHAGQESRAAKAGVPVTFTAALGGASGDFGEGGTSYTATTDANGEAAVPWYLAVGTHTISATVPTVDPTPITFTATGIANGQMTGTIFSTGNVPLSGASVRLQEIDLIALTNSAGHYDFGGVPPGTYTVLVHHAGYTDKTYASVVVTGGSLEFSVTLNTQADFVVSSMTTNPATPTNSSVSYVIVITNVGETDAPASEGLFSEGWSSPPGVPPSVAGTSRNPTPVGAIPAGGSVTVTVAAILSEGNGTYSGFFQANTGSPQVPEFISANNTGSASYTLPPVIIGLGSAPTVNLASVGVAAPWLLPSGM
jgi:hypothetical protein